MGELVLYHNPRCSKSRAALALLQERGLEPRVVEYLKHPPTAEELAGIGAKLGQPPRAWVRTGEAAWKEAGLGEASGDAEILAAIAVHPILMQRPIAVRDGRAVVGRPPERVLELL